MTDRKVDIFGWSEPNLEWNDKQTYEMTRKQVKNIMRGGQWLTTTSKIPSLSTYKPGGNVMGSTYAINARTSQKGMDEYG